MPSDKQARIRMIIMERSRVQRFVGSFADAIPALQSAHEQATFLDQFLEEDRTTQQSIVGAFVQLLVDWRKGNKSDLVDERNEVAWGLASLVSDLS